MANKWFEYPKKKPKTGMYLCTVKVGEDLRVRTLCYVEKMDKWLDVERNYIFNKFQVYEPIEGPNGEEALGQVPTGPYIYIKDVVAFKNLPKPYRGA